MAHYRDRARDWALWLTRQRSVTGTHGEAALAQRLAERIRATPALAGAEVWTIGCGDALGRECCAVLVRGQGPDTVLLTGHFDTVTDADYGDLQPVACEPEALAGALLRRLASPGTSAERLAKADLESGDFLPGRGLLDMKAGLGAALAALELWAAGPERAGNLLFVAVPDEEVTSVGARALAEALPQIAAERGLAVRAAINCDCVTDEGDGSLGQVVALGSVGKLLVTALVAGVPAHASQPYEGLNAGAIAAALVARAEWAPELADGQEGAAGIPPVLLSLRDGREGYDVTTPATVFATWNVLSQGRGAMATLGAFRAIALEAAAGLAAALAARQEAVTGRPVEVPGIPVSTLAELAASLPEAAAERLAARATALAGEGLSLPDQNRLLAEEAWRLSGRSGPAILLGFGALPYLPVHLGHGPEAQGLRGALDRARAAVEAAHGCRIGTMEFFPGISDLSFFGEGDASEVPFMAANTLAWGATGWSGRIANLPAVNVGPWGRSYHTPLERLHAPYAFDVLPDFLLRIAREVLATGGR
ncbi:M20/M25/M40 family metallo-hydrolase [Cereibacter sphaeroides]|uniref:M20/M25/M40 family metallo-hydrolase n=1 Tax=Cereibacter sphaeroides TaxID=1063 RepID=A0AAX1UEH3_CERSP|nr:M20/M25/M40 family metallo-hydrolase [Cereibacter sphaeroides]RHZ90530.1 M20/M25/M40 family metallo-hydrolase [Cereibacter sphaeroides]